MQQRWDPEQVKKVVSEGVSKHKIDTVSPLTWNGHEEELSKTYCSCPQPCSQVITFDDYGVSGHPNHQACFAGVR